MNLVETLQMTAAGIVSILVIRGMYCMIANDKATSKICGSKGEIQKLLGAHYLYEICNGRDISPSEVQFSLISNTTSGLPSRIALQWLKDIKSGAATVEQLYAACLAQHRKHQAYLKKKRTL